MTAGERATVIATEFVYVAAGIYFATLGCRGLAAACFLACGLLGLWCWMGRGS